MGQDRAKWWVVIGSIISVIFLGGLSRHPITQATGSVQSAATAIGASWLYRFDPNTHTFVTITLPVNAIPMEMAITGTSPTHVWFSEYGRQQIGHLVYTDTFTSQLVEHPITSTTSPQPFQVTLAGNNLWFTERGANRVGRLNTLTGQLDEFYDHGLSPNANLADIQIAPNGRVWIGAPGSQRLVALDVTAPHSYTFTEYHPISFVIAPVSLGIADNTTILMAMSESITRSLVEYYSSIYVVPFDVTQPPKLYAREITIASTFAWTANTRHDLLDQIEIGTFPIINHRVTISAPIALATETANSLWVLQDTRPPSISHVVYDPDHFTATVTPFVLPKPELVYTDIAFANDGSVWLTAYQPARQYLPLIVKN